MPLVGTICCQTGIPTPFSSCISQCQSRSCVHPLPLLVAMSSNEKKRDGAGISATMVSQCPLQTVLKRTVDYYEGPGEYHARWLGEGVHGMIHSHGPYEGVIQEKRIRKSLSFGDFSLEVSGQPDWYDTVNNHLDDWKYTKSCPTRPYDDHVSQVNIYAWLIDGGVWDDGELSHDVVETASITYIDKFRTVSVDVDLWSTEATEAMMKRKLESYVEYLRNGTMPEGIGVDGPDSWKTRFCPFRGTGKCCGDAEIER